MAAIERSQQQTVGAKCQFLLNDKMMEHGEFTMDEKVDISNKKLLIESLLKLVQQTQKSCNEFLSNEMDNEKNTDAPPKKKQRR